MVVAHALIPALGKEEAGGSQSLRPTWFTERVPGQPGLHEETLSQKTKTKRKEKNGILEVKLRQCGKERADRRYMAECSTGHCCLTQGLTGMVGVEA